MFSPKEVASAAAMFLAVFLAAGAISMLAVVLMLSGVLFR